MSHLFQALQLNKDTMHKLLTQQGRALHPIIGDGNCFFRALSYVIYDTEDFHDSVRGTIVQFAELNADSFTKYCTSGNMQTHIQNMKRERVYATQMEAHVAASCLQRQVYIYTQKHGSGEFYWERFDPIPLQALKPHSVKSCIGMHPFRCHIELCHVNHCHYDVVTLQDGEPCPEPPFRAVTISNIDLCKVAT